MKKYSKTGWYGESHRHYLAAKGIKTNKYNASKYVPVSIEGSNSKGSGRFADEKFVKEQLIAEALLNEEEHSSMYKSPAKMQEAAKKIAAKKMQQVKLPVEALPKESEDTEYEGDSVIPKIKVKFTDEPNEDYKFKVNVLTKEDLDLAKQVLKDKYERSLKVKFDPVTGEPYPTEKGYESIQEYYKTREDLRKLRKETIPSEIAALKSEAYKDYVTTKEVLKEKAKRAEELAEETADKGRVSFALQFPRVAAAGAELKEMGKEYAPVVKQKFSSGASSVASFAKNVRDRVVAMKQRRDEAQLAKQQARELAVQDQLNDLEARSVAQISDPVTLSVVLNTKSPEVQQKVLALRPSLRLRR